MYKILYVDNEPELLELGRIYLESGGDFTVDTRASAEEGLEGFRECGYDAIVSDDQMPGTDGLEFLKQIRAEYGDIPFILFTGRGREDVIIEAIDNGVDFCIRKGGAPEARFFELADKVKVAIERRRARIEQSASEKKFSSVFQASPISQIISDRKTGRIIEVNDHFLESTGLHRREVIGKTFSDIGFVVNEPVKGTLHRLIKKTKAFRNREIQVRTPQGEIRTALLSMTYVSAGGRDLVYAQALDISSKKKTEELIHALLNAPPDVSMLIDTDGKILGLNKAAAIRFGKPAEELIGSDVYLLLSPELAQYRREKVRKVILSKKPLVFSDDRTGVLYENHIYPIVTPEGDVSSIAIYSRDVTDARRSQEELQSMYEQLAAAQEELRARYEELRQNRDTLLESEEKYRALIGHTLDGVFIAQDGRLVFVNEVFARMIGYAADELAGCPITEVIAPDDRERILARHRGRLIGKSLPDIYEFSLLHKDRNTRIRVRMSVGTGKFQGGPATIGTVHDVTAERRHEEELRESEMRFQKISDATVEGILMHKERIIQEVNGSACTLWGYTREELIGKEVIDLVVPEARAYVLEKWRTRSEEPYESMGLRSDGSRFLGEMRSRNIIYHNEAIRLTSIRDITAQRQAENSLREINKKLHLLSGITRHDIRNKLTSLIGLLDLARNMNDHRKMPELLNRLISIAETIDNQVEFTRDYQELGILQPSWSNVHVLVRTAASGVDLGKIHLVNVQDNLEIFADPLIEKVFYNLIENAVNYGDTISRIDIHSEEMPDGYCIIVEDDGIGIKDKDKERIFERGVGMNTGFGLFLTREILAITGITIRETGVHLQGARFEISVPKAACRRKPARKKTGKKRS